MFDNLKACKDIIEGAYRKFKSYYYYNKNYILIKEKIANFEANYTQMQKTFDKLASILHLQNDENNYVELLIKKVNIAVLPKKFTNEKKNDNLIISNESNKEQCVSEVNFFIDLPIELNILDTVLCVLIGQYVADFEVLSDSVYGNTLNERALYFLDRINWGNNFLFDIYYNKYTQWRNGAFDSLEENYTQGKNSLLVTVDIKAYYYSIILSAEKIKKILIFNDIYDDYGFLLQIYNKICLRYFELLKRYRKFEYEYKKDEYCLPIGMMTSMLLANLYLKDFDTKINGFKALTYYGRYVDDMLMVITVDKLNDNLETEYVLNKFFVTNNIFINNQHDYSLYGYDELKIKKDKVKAVYIDCAESRALIDIYNKFIRTYPSQVQPISNWDLELGDFEESVFLFDKFKRSNKVRDLEAMAVDPYKIGRYFAQLSSKFSNVKLEKQSQKDIETQIKKINAFLLGEQGLEYYTQWQNYMYFLICVNKEQELRVFYKRIKKIIENLKAQLNEMYKYKPTIVKKLKSTLIRHLQISYYIAYSLKIDKVPEKKKSNVQRYINANLFNHNLIKLPLANYIYNGEKALLNLNIEDFKEVVIDLETNFKFKWSPRFIHYDEIQSLLFYNEFNNFKAPHENDPQFLFEKFCLINRLVCGEPFVELIGNTRIKGFKDNYILREYTINDDTIYVGGDINVCTGNVSVNNSDIIDYLKHGTITMADKKTIWKILNETYLNCHKDVKLLILPELFYPYELIKELLAFARRSQIAIVVGLRYLKTIDNRVKNCFAAIIPFVKEGYKNAAIFIREKNDYSPIEKCILARHGFVCVDKKKPNYEIYSWKGIDIAPMVCFELTDIVARAILKGNTDIIALPVNNQDTTYFSNIIESTVRDLHCMIVQANTSIYGDSRVTLPYDRNTKDIFKIKGGINDNVLVGSLNLNNIFNYQKNYYQNEYEYLEFLLKRRKGKRQKDKNASSDRQHVKRLSARFTNKRARRKE